MSYTKGPWHTAGDPAWGIESEDGTSVAQAHWVTPGPAGLDETRLANARLIAAAPELLEVAELFIEILKADKRMNRMDNCGLDVYPECEKKVRAALRKARGE